MYIATFYTHYGAQTFHKMQKSIDSKAELMPVPRALSASCGICVMFELDRLEKNMLKNMNKKQRIILWRIFA